MKRRGLLILWLAVAILAVSPGSVWAQQPTGWSTPEDITQQSSANWRAFGVEVCDPFQNMHIFWADNVDAGAAVFYRDDTSGKWSEPLDIISLTDSRIFYLKTAISPQTNTVFLAWVNYNGGGDLLFTQAPLAEAGNPKAWLKPQRLDEHVFDPAMVVDSKGVLHLIYAASDSDSLNHDVIHIQSDDDGITWSDPQVILSRTFFRSSYIRVEASIDGADRIHVGLTLRSFEYGISSEVGYIRSPDAGQTWDAYRKFQDTGRSYQGVEWIAPYAFGRDEVHLTWHDPGRMHVVSKDGGVTWSQPDEIARLGGAFGGPNELVKDSSGKLYAVLAVINGVYSVAWDGTQWNPAEPIDLREIDAHGQHITMCQGNKLHVVYYDRTGDLTVWHSVREVAAPLIARKPIPGPTEQPTLAPTETVTPLASLTPAQIARVSSNASQVESPMHGVWLGVLPALLLLLVFLVFWMIRSHG